MNRRRIVETIQKTIDAWAESVDDDKIKEIIQNRVIVTGGCIVSMLLDEHVNDYDVYLTNQEDVIAVSEYYMNKADEKTRKEMFDPRFIDDERYAIIRNDFGSYKVVDAKGKFSPVFFTDNAITLTDDVQIITRFYGDPKGIHENFDYVHTTSYFLSEDGTLHLKKKAMEAVLARELRYVGSRYPLASIVRMRKFIKRGWHINAGHILKIAMQLSELDLKDPLVLRDQLIGVDLYYFNELLDSLNGDFDYNYLSKEIDKIFDGDK